MINQGKFEKYNDIFLNTIIFISLIGIILQLVNTQEDKLSEQTQALVIQENLNVNSNTYGSSDKNRNVKNLEQWSGF